MQRAVGATEHAFAFRHRNLWENENADDDDDVVSNTSITCNREKEHCSWSFMVVILLISSLLLLLLLLLYDLYHTESSIARTVSNSKENETLVTTTGYGCFG